MHAPYHLHCGALTQGSSRQTEGRGNAAEPNEERAAAGAATCVPLSNRQSVHRLDVAQHRPDIEPLWRILGAHVAFVAVDQLEHHCADCNR
jgi:hypothetical protein